jgi:hypothetical protein
MSGIARSGVTRSRVYLAVAVVLAAAILVTVGTTVALRQTADQTPSDTPASATNSPPTTTPTRTPGPTLGLVPDRFAGPEATAVCDAELIENDLGSPGSGSRIIDCDGGWAVMGSAISGDPYWVVSRNGRWRRAEGVSIYTMTCPDEAIAMGVPAWMAHKHLVTCRTSNWSLAPPTLQRGPSAPAPTPAPGVPSAPIQTPTPTQTPPQTTSPSSAGTRTPTPTSTRDPEATTAGAAATRTGRRPGGRHRIGRRIE